MANNDNANRDEFEDEALDVVSDDLENIHDLMMAANMSNRPTFTVHSPEGDGEEGGENTFVPLVDLPPPPDGGWGWVVVFASFSCNMILDGLAYCFGVLLEPLVIAFNSNNSTISWVGSLLNGFYLMSGPIVGGLVNKFGCRSVCIFGAIVAAIGISLSVISPNVPVLMLTYGFIGGFGLGLIFLPSIIAVGYYFERKRALATGIAVCGSGVGTFLFPPLATTLLTNLGWQGTNLVFSGLCLLCIIFGLLMRPLELTVKQAEDLEAEKVPEKKEFTVLLPDGTHRNKLTDDPTKLTPNVSFSEGGGQAHSGHNFPVLPTITEQQTITQDEQPKHKSIQDVFPGQTSDDNDGDNEDDDNDDNKKDDEKDDQDEKELLNEEEQKETEDQMEEQPQQSFWKSGRISGKRRRTRSENVDGAGGPGGRFSVTPINKSPSKSVEGITRNLTAPNFVDPSTTISRNSSGVNMHGLSRLLSVDADQEYKLFGIPSCDLRSNMTLHLEPASMNVSLSRRGSTAPGQVKPIVRPMYRKDIFYAGSINHLASQQEINDEQQPQTPYLQPHSHKISRAPSRQISQVPSYATLNEYRHSIISIPKQVKYLSIGSIPRGSIVASHLSLRPVGDEQKSNLVIMDDAGKTPLITVLKEMLNVSLLKNRLFFLICISNVFGMLGFYTPFIYLPNMATMSGIAVEDANFLISVIGISNTIGRVLAGWIADFPSVNSQVVTIFANFACGIIVIIFPYCGNYPTFVVMSLAFGLVVAAYVSLTSIVLVDLLGLDNLTSAFGLLVLFRGVSSMIGPPMAGAIYDSTMSYNVSFMMSGGFLIVGALFNLIVEILNRRDKKSL